MVNNNSVAVTNGPTVGEYFAHKTIFLTGGTGFIGSVLIEALLSTSPNIGNIYVLLRGKYGSNANGRLNRLLSKRLFENHSKEILAKIKPVVGVLDAPNLGFPDELLEKLRNEVNIIFHCAATIKFNIHLREAIRINLIGTLRTVEFAKSLKNLSSYIHLSTAFCNSNYSGLISEKVYPSMEDPFEMIKLAENDEAWVNFNTLTEWSHLIKGHPNTYTFTKQLAENLVTKEMAGYPSAIVRPSIVYGTYEFPFSGWVGSANSGHLGFLTGFYKGLFRTISGKSQSVLDIIPCDYVTNSAIVMSWFVGTHNVNIPEVIHCTSNERNRLTLNGFSDIINDRVKVYPSLKMIWKPAAKIRFGWRYTISFYLFHILPTLLFYLPEKLLHLGIRNHSSLKLMGVYNKGNKAFDLFASKNFKFSSKNALRIMSRLHPVDVNRYQFDAEKCDWGVLIERCFLGLRRDYFKEESYEIINLHRIIFKVFEIVHILGIGFLLLIFYKVFGAIEEAIALTHSLSIWLSSALWLFILWL